MPRTPTPGFARSWVARGRLGCHASATIPAEIGEQAPAQNPVGCDSVLLVTSARFFTVADAPYFAGTVALFNSLRLTGHEHELVVLDRGLAEHQREALRKHVTLYELPRERFVHPYLVKPFPALMELQGVVVLVDSDMIVTTALEPILERAAGGKICAFPNHYSALWRRFDEWSEIFGLAAPLRSEIYLNSGFVAVSVDHWPALFRRWWEACEQIEIHLESGGDPELVDQPDQDALNAILRARSPRGSRGPPCVRVAPRSGGDRGREDTQVPGGRTDAAPAPHPADLKVWQPGGWRHVEYQTRAYVSLLPRVLFGEDAAIRLSPRPSRTGCAPARCRSSPRAQSAATTVCPTFRRARRAPRRVPRDAPGRHSA